MTLLMAIHLLALGAAPTLGLLAFWTNRKRTANVFFLVFSLVMTAWLAFLCAGFYASSVPLADLCIRGSCMVSVFAAFAFNGLRISLARPDLDVPAIARATWPLVAATAAVSIMCGTRFFLVATGIPPESAIPVPRYGPGIMVYAAFHLSAFLYLVIRFVQDTRRATGIVRTEMQFVLLGSAVGIGFAILSSVLVPLVTARVQSVQYAPLAAIAVEGIIAYGIATRRIMEVPHLLRRATAYILLSAYLGAVYVAVWHGVNLLIQSVNMGGEFPFAHLLAALALAFSVAPAHGRLQNFANRLFVNVQGLDVGDTLRKANRILSSITTIDDLLEQFSLMVARAVGTDSVSVYLTNQGKFIQRYPKPADGAPAPIADQDAIAVLLSREPEPLSADILRRLQPSPLRTQAGRRMAEMHAAVAVAIQSKSGMEGIILLGPRLSGRIYGAEEQRTLQILCNNLSVALENAKLYTQVQNSALYNNILLDNLVSGVVAVDALRRVTVFNREAQRITRMDEPEILPRSIEGLPYPLAQSLGSTLETGVGVRDREVVLRAGASRDDITIRLGTALFRGHTGETLGALLVFNDVSAVRRLEQQVRRTDRLASLGTLSAGMAHEIKNPLVTLKTFTQLLPERYDDPEFRSTFADLLGHEVKRIDSLVNQLLNLARPTKPSLAPIHLHSVVENTLRLVQQQLLQKNIVLSKSLAAPADLIQGDHDPLVQALLNLLLNAIDAMEDRGELTVTTRVEEQESSQLGLWSERAAESFIRLSIKDTGKGIKPEDVPHVFDPFFTTKSTGTGLGLSVSHGIIEEHHGMIDVESVLDRGTTFHLLFPLARKEAEV